jgi:hypothetical protein
MYARFQRNSQVEIAPLKEESVLFNPQNNKFCVLNQTACFLWQLLEQPRTMDEMVAALRDSFEGADQSDPSKDVQEAVEQLIAVECVEGIPA